MIRPRQVLPQVGMFPARTPTLPPATHTSSYAIGTREVVLVEPATPYEDEQREWLAWARGLASGGRRLLGIVLTHHHADHVGGAEVLARELALPLWAHPETARRVELRIDRLLDDGDAIVLDGPSPDAWRVLHTPGHAPGHVCLLESSGGALVVGDMVASTGTILIAPGDGDMRVYLEQLDRLAALRARLALPAHGDPIEEPTRLFRSYIAHRLRREAKIFACVVAAGDAGAIAEELVPRAYDDVPRETLPVALLSLKAHLAKLIDDGRVRRSGDLRYSARGGESA